MYMYLCENCIIYVYIYLIEVLMKCYSLSGCLRLMDIGFVC